MSSPPPSPPVDPVAVPPQLQPLPGSWRGATTRRERAALLLGVVKPPLYSVALVPALVGFAAAFMQTGAAAPGRLGCCVAAAVAVIAWLNLSNDAWDAATSVDAAKTESAVRLTGSARAVSIAAWCCLAAGVAGFAALLLPRRDPVPAVLLFCALACGVLYQAPPFRWSYKGRGEPLCFLAFGPLATPAFYLLACPVGTPLSPALGLCSLLVGATTAAILFCSHFHQTATDEAAGKRSPVVALGTDGAASALAVAVGATHALAVAAALLRLLPLPVAVASLAAAPLGSSLVKFVSRHHGEPDVVRTAKFRAVRWHAAHGLAITLAMAACGRAG